MARTRINPQKPTPTGIGPTYEPANVDGHDVQNRPGTLVHVKNGGAGALVITIPTPGDVEDLAVADRTINVAAGAEAMFTLTPAVTDSDGYVDLDFDVIATVTVAAFRP